MKSDFWIERWKTNDTPWQLSAPEPLLVRHFPKRAAQNVLVPLCGKTVDLLWLQEQGHKVTGVELSDIACHSFFKDAKIDYKTQGVRNFEVFESKNIKIWCGDFFALQNDDLPKLDSIYDRAALIALPTDLRKKYAERITEIVQARGSENFEMLLILKEKIGSTHEGPPFLVSLDELQSIYASHFKIEALEAVSFSNQAAPDIKVVDTAYRLQTS